MTYRTGYIVIVRGVFFMIFRRGVRISSSELFCWHRAHGSDVNVSTGTRNEYTNSTSGHFIYLFFFNLGHFRGCPDVEDTVPFQNSLRIIVDNGRIRLFWIRKKCIAKDVNLLTSTGEPRQTKPGQLIIKITFWNKNNLDEIVEKKIKEKPPMST